ncbi:GDP-mannose 4,6-dehydratase [Leptospira alstonii]|uniref:Polysaccharide biosynthesis protein n=2 Tax=Leptospira alstonii TaxID=28452 RepID=M6CKM0_9LEPT|nr:GDP-mannose 4,6-dehydratase [Leptospira alstonii]EMJ91161.1 polysaccharide biosynthesis protein [Leptospira alstonii serovar Sichuan str. 79601]EQA80559.1 polysaccharide biosynthesis protein [Leptospira alstonii serovar Pingchang str. 80-412]
MKCLITGAAGFVGGYLLKELKHSYTDFLGIGIQPGPDRKEDSELPRSYRSAVCDIRNLDQVRSIVHEFSPDAIFHLAAQPFVPKAVEDPGETLEINVHGTLNLLESLRSLKKKVRFVYVSSSDIYGNVPESCLPVQESVSPSPLNPYSSSKSCAEIYCLQYHRWIPELEVVIARPFNHTGPKQSLNFVIPNFCSQVLEALKRSESERKILVGDLSSTRDFLDVRDVARAYRILAEKGRPGEIYNICSGKEVVIRDVLDKIILTSGTKIPVEVDPSRFRPAEMKRLFGDNGKLQKLGWEPNYDLSDTIRDVYQWYRMI